MQNDPPGNATKVLRKWGLLFLIFNFAFLIFNLPETEAHRFHTTLTRIDYNTKEQTAEITIQLFTHDIEEVLANRSGKRLSIDKTPDADKLLFDFLNENWTLKDAKGAVLKLNWVGKEVETDTVRLYVETKLPGGLESTSLQNQLFCGIYEDQVNLLIAKTGDKKADLAFKPGDTFRELIFKAVSDNQ